MKIRIRDNSIRFRLERGEVELVRESGRVFSQTNFPDGRTFGYAVESTPASISPAAFYSENTVTVRLPETVVLAWATTEQVSISAEQILEDGEKLTILVEKDFACLVPRDGEDESDMYVHPDKSSARC